MQIGLVAYPHVSAQNRAECTRQADAQNGYVAPFVGNAPKTRYECTRSRTQTGSLSSCPRARSVPSFACTNLKLAVNNIWCPCSAPLTPPHPGLLRWASQAFFFSKETLELVNKIELPGKPSLYHIVNGFQEEKGGPVTVTLVKLREGGGRAKLEAVFEDIMGSRQGEIGLSRKDAH